jgi:hypothetical protein
MKIYNHYHRAQLKFHAEPSLLTSFDWNGYFFKELAWFSPFTSKPPKLPHSDVRFLNNRPAIQSNTFLLQHLLLYCDTKQLRGVVVIYHLFYNLPHLLLNQGMGWSCQDWISDVRCRIATFSEFQNPKSSMLNSGELRGWLYTQYPRFFIVSTIRR